MGSVAFVTTTLPALAAVMLLLLQTSVSATSLRRLDAMEYQAMMVGTPPGQSCLVERGFDYVGNDIANKPGPVQSCCDQCVGVSGCRAWSWTSHNGGTCWFKSAQGKVVVNPSVQSALYFRGGVPFCELENDVDFVGNDITNVRSSSADGCCSACHITLGCRAYSWTDFNGGTCWLKSSAGQKVYKAGAKASIAYPIGYRNTCSLPTRGVDYVGNDIGNKPSSTPEGCCDICKQTNNCRAYSWTNQNGGTCWLKSTKTTTIAKADVTSALVVTNELPACAMTEEDTDYVGNDVGNAPARDYLECCSICGKNSACKVWSWSSYNGGTCWLKSAKGQTSYKAGVKSAVLLFE